MRNGKANTQLIGAGEHKKLCEAPWQQVSGRETVSRVTGLCELLKARKHGTSS